MISEENMIIIETQLKQRAYDGKWERIVEIIDDNNKYTMRDESGNTVTYTPTKWVTVGVYDYLLELE